MCWCAEVLGRIRDIRGTFTAARFPPRRNGLQIGATQPKTSWQHLDLLQKSRFDHPQRVARLTPKNFADADMPISKGPCVIGNGLRTRCSKISSIASNCPDDASSSFFNLSSVVMGSPPGCSAAHTGQSQCFARKSGNRTAMNWK